MMSAAKKIKLSADFTKRGRFSDEIALKFDDGNELFVSKSFLCMASPVFDAMLTRDFKEKKTSKVKLEGKNSDSFLQFLQCIHPAVMEPVTQITVLKVAPLAEEYQHEVLILRCKDMINTSLKIVYAYHLQANKHNSTKYKSMNYMAWLLLFLRLSSALNYDAITDLAIEYLGNCSHVYYSGSKWFNGCSLSEDAMKLHAKLKEIYQSLPENLKIQVMLQRLENIDC